MDQGVHWSCGISDGIVRVREKFDARGWGCPQSRAPEHLNTLIIRLRSYQDPVAVLEQELLRPGVIWKKPAIEAIGIRPLLERASRYIRPRRLLIVLDQFEECDTTGSQ
jgi:hypothetical protein